MPPASSLATPLAEFAEHTTGTSTRAFVQLDATSKGTAAFRPASVSRRRRLLCGVLTLLTVGIAVVVAGTLSRHGLGAGLFDPRYRPGGWAFEADSDEEEETEELIENLKNQIHLLTPEQARERFGAIQPRGRAPPRQSKIDHVVVLFMENHAADHFFGCMDLPGFDGVRGGHRFPKDPTDPSKGHVDVTCGDASYVCRSGPSYDTFASKFPASGGNPNTYPYSPQSDNYSALHGASASGTTAVQMFSPSQVPIKRALAESFGVFNKMYTAVPSASSPNHLFAQSATSCGMPFNGLYNDCLGKNYTFPQLTIYDSLRLHNVSFGLYMNSTCGLDGKPCHGEDQHNPDSASAINTPDVAMEGVARHKDRFFSQETFYRRAANGTLPSLSWILPPQQACDHPCHDVAKGERLLKDVYEALRAGPGWGKTLLIMAYDDAGGYYDHVVPPYEGVPADEAPCHLTGPHTKPPYQCPGGGPAFDFRRLGLRTTAMLISPWVAKGAVFQEPKAGPTPTSQFELSSIPATIKNLFNLSTFLTKRDAWAGNFMELLLDTPRTDAPMHLPDAPPAASPWDPPPPDGERGERDVVDGGDGGDDGDDGDDGQRARRSLLSVGSDGSVAPAIAQHCSSIHGGEEQQCKGHTVPNLKQRRNVRLLAKLTGEPEPDVEAMSFSEVDAWLAQRWRVWMQRK